MFTKNIFIILSAVVVFGDAGFVDTLQKCSFKDNECQRSSLQSMLKQYGKSGIPEFQVPPFDPVTLKDVSLPLLNVVNLTFVEGKLKGISGCTVNKYNANVEKKFVTLDITCDLTLKGNYKAVSDGPLVKSLLGGDSLVGDGKTKVKLEKFNIQFGVNFDIVNENGDTYIKSKDEKVKFKYDVLGQALFAANGLLLDGKDVSEQVTTLLNQSWKLVIQSVGDQLIERAVVVARKLIKSIFDNVPTKYYVIEDLAPYAS